MSANDPKQTSSELLSRNVVECFYVDTSTVLSPFRRGCSLLNRCARSLVVLSTRLNRSAEAMSVAKCRKRAQEILAQADCDPRHSRKLIAAAECWLELASCLRRLEKSFQHRRPQEKTASVSHLFYADPR
jgi:hypothetical protein